MKSNLREDFKKETKSKNEKKEVEEWENLIRKGILKH